MNEALENYVVRVYPQWDGGTVIEIRPRTGTWKPIMIAIPIEEKHLLLAEPFRFGPINHYPEGIPAVASDDYGELNDGVYWYVSAPGDCTPEQSCFVGFSGPPSEFLFGALDDGEVYRYRPPRSPEPQQ